MPYASEAEYRAAVEAYRALHEVFYRFHKRVRGQQSAADPSGPAADLASADERDYGVLAGECLPNLARAYAGPRDYLDRLTETLRRLGETRQASPRAVYDPQLMLQAYVDIDNILQDLLRERESYPTIFDDAFSAGDPQTEEVTRKPPT